MGIIDAFHSLNLAGAGTLRAVAPGISEALITTAAGLLVAIPAVIGYNQLTGQLREFGARMDDFGRELLNAIEKRRHGHSASGAADSAAGGRPHRPVASEGLLIMAFSVRSGGQTRTQTALAEINITPLVDVVLVLLLIFMLTAPVLQSGINVAVPHTRSVNQLTEQRTVVTIDKNQNVYLQDGKNGGADTAINLTDLTRQLRGETSQDPRQTHHLRSSRRARSLRRLRIGNGSSQARRHHQHQHRHPAPRNQDI